VLALATCPALAVDRRQADATLWRSSHPDRFPSVTFTGAARLWGDCKDVALHVFRRRSRSKLVWRADRAANRSGRKRNQALSNLSSEGLVQWRGFKEQFIDVAPAPVFPWLEGLDYRIVCGVEMLCRVFVRRVVTATDVTTAKAETQVHPPAACAEALLAAFGCSRFDNANLVEMCALHLVCL
jgi:hypothetical protein